MDTGASSWSKRHCDCWQSWRIFCLLMCIFLCFLHDGCPFAYPEIPLIKLQFHFCDVCVSVCHDDKSLRLQKPLALCTRLARVRKLSRLECAKTSVRWRRISIHFLFCLNGIRLANRNRNICALPHQAGKSARRLGQHGIRPISAPAR